MGGVVSSGQNNDDLIDNLLDADYIKTSDIERVFRAVDRAEYFLPEARHYAYKDSAWKNGHLHLSAPCIYSEVMEGLRLQAGLSFLNLGSGTGYLSTMVGLLLGNRGINHGIEIHNDVIEYANKKLDDFKKHSGAIDEFDFCEPKFKQGNCLCLNSDGMLYDRVYCGAACPEQYEHYMKHLIKIGGILVMPLNDQLLQIKRNSENSWDVRCLLPVSFASLINAPEKIEEWIPAFDVEPASLQAMCRSNIRNILRKMVELEHPPVKKSIPINKAPKKKRALRRCVVAVFESDESSDDEVERNCNRNQNVEVPNGPVLARDDFLNMVLQTIENTAMIENRMIPVRRNPRTESNQGDKTESMDTDSNESNDDSERNANANETQVEVEVHPSKNTLQNEEKNESSPQDAPNSNSTSENSNKSSKDLNASTSSSKAEAADAKNESNTENKSSNKREKFDSGLGDEIVESHYDSSSENDEDMAYIPYVKNRNVGRVRGPHTRRWVPQISLSTSEEEREEEDETLKPNAELNMYKSPYSEYMRGKIQQLPLPQILIRYLNFYRDF